MLINDFYYFDHQATCPLDLRVFEEMSRFMINSVGNAHSNEHSFGWAADKAVTNAKVNIAGMIGCDPDEIFFTSGATEANNHALKGFDFGARRKLIHSSIEHKCVIETGRCLKAADDIEVKIVNVDAEGHINLARLEELANESIGVFSFIGVHNEVGTIQNFEKVANICRQHDITIHADMVQAPLAIDISNIIDHVDTLSLSAHKFYGPMGIGCLYIRRDIQKNYAPIIHGGGQQGGMRSGTVPVPLAVGMGEASKIITNNELETASIRHKNELLWHELMSLSISVKLNGPELSKRHPANLNVSFQGYDSADIIAAVQPKLAISSGSACTSGNPEQSHVLINMGLTPDLISSAIRFGIGRKTSKGDILNAVQILRDAIAKLPKEV